MADRVEPGARPGWGGRRVTRRHRLSRLPALPSTACERRKLSLDARSYGHRPHIISSCLRPGPGSDHCPGPEAAAGAGASRSTRAPPQALQASVREAQKPPGPTQPSPAAGPGIDHRGPTFAADSRRGRGTTVEAEAGGPRASRPAVRRPRVTWRVRLPIQSRGVVGPEKPAPARPPGPDHAIARRAGRSPGGPQHPVRACHLHREREERAVNATCGPSAPTPAGTPLLTTARAGAEPAAGLRYAQTCPSGPNPTCFTHRLEEPSCAPRHPPPRPSPVVAPARHRRRGLAALGRHHLGRSGRRRPGTSARRRRRRNVLWIVADDQPRRSLRYMPHTMRLVAGRGLAFANGYTAVPWCGPARRR